VASEDVFWLGISGRLGALPSVQAGSAGTPHAGLLKEAIDTIVLKELIEVGKVTPTFDRTYRLKTGPDRHSAQGGGQGRWTLRRSA
jgi:hypothetical protein